MNLEHLFVERFGMVGFYSSVVFGFLLFLRSDRSQHARRRWVTPLTIYAVTYAAIVLCVWALDLYLDWRTDTFDLDGDGLFSLAEQTPEQEYFMNRLTMDTARTFIPFTAVIHAGLVVGFAYVLTLVRRGVERVVRQVR